MMFRCSVHVGPAEPKGKPSDNQFKRSKAGNVAIETNLEIYRSIAIDKLDGAIAYFRRDIHLALHAMRTDSRKDIVDL
jgi:hypothetical protein